MLITLLSWLLIFAISLIIGFFLLKICKFGGIKTLDVTILSGMVFLTVYAQFFSLFAKVGLLSNLILLLFCIIIGVIYRKDLLVYIMSGAGFSSTTSKHVLFGITVFIILISVFLASGPVIQYDTYLYHAQAIRWIEESGIIPGLGNLHNRLAYNSSIFSLQALFSFSYLKPYSMHSVNGFFVAFFLLYSVLTLNVFRGQKLAASDLFKFGLIFYYCFGGVKTYVSSPGSDILTLSMVLYIAMKWSELCEKKTGESDDFTHDYGLLSLFALWAISVKLSSALMVLLAIYPAIVLIRAKKWRDITLFVIIGFLIVLPFLTRNVIISGYLLYPYPALDFFSFDWKMPAWIAAYDSQEIMAYGRSMRNHADYTAPFSTWFPVWYSELTLRYRLLVWLNPFSLLVCLVYVGFLVKKKVDFPRITLFLVLSANLLMWFFSSPLIRYGMVYLILLPILITGVILDKVGDSKRNIIITYSFTCLILAYCALSMLRHIEVQGKTPLLHPSDYMVKQCIAVEWQGNYIYLPTDDDRTCYHHFPSTTAAYRLEMIELRGVDIRSGFRAK